MSWLLRRIQGLLTRGRVTGSDDSGDIQVVDVEGRRGEVLREVPRPQPYGLRATPPAGCEVILGRLGGDPDSPIILSLDGGQVGAEVQAGETRLYDSNSHSINLTSSGISLDADTGTLTMDATGGITLDAGAAGVVRVTALSLIVDAQIVILGASAPSPSVLPVLCGNPASPTPSTCVYAETV